MVLDPLPILGRQPSGLQKPPLQLHGFVSIHVMERNGDFLKVSKIREGFRSGGERHAQVDRVAIVQDMRTPTSCDLRSEAGVAGPHKNRPDAFDMRLQSAVDSRISTFRVAR